MGQFDYKNICLQIEVKNNLTDLRFLDFLHNWDFTMDEYMHFYESVKGTIFNENSNRIIEFFLNYKNGILKPDRCGTYNPLKHRFNCGDTFKYQEWLSFPSGCLILKKNKMFDVEIKNRYWGLSWSGNNSIVTKPKRILPENLGLITFWFPKQKKINIEFLKSLLVDFCEYLSTDNGMIFDQENKEVLYDVSNLQRVGTFLDKIYFD